MLKYVVVLATIGLLTSFFLSILTLWWVGGRGFGHLRINTRSYKPLVAKREIDCGNGMVGVLNDGFCDCTETGSDEPETAGCSYFASHKKQFICTSEGRIFTSRVLDGVNDCSDGSDEINYK